jgi:hypothetical protein
MHSSNKRARSHIVLKINDAFLTLLMLASRRGAIWGDEMRFAAPVDFTAARIICFARRDYSQIEEEAAGARPGAELTEPIGLSACTPGAGVFATVAHGSHVDKMTDTLSENPSS